MKLNLSFAIFYVFLVHATSMAQLGETYDLERPEKYKEKIIGYEKTYTKKFKLPRKFLQNTVSHYNFFFNANEKLKYVFNTAKNGHKDTFDQLLTYYPYTLDFTSTMSKDLDSVVQKASGGILTHDLRTNWVDNFYLLIGKSYLLQKKYDSAEMTFNYINYEYAPKNKDKERILTGSSENELNNTFSIATKENNSILKKLFERPPSRNEALLWMVRTYIEADDFGSASGLIQTLQHDPVFPKRLHNDLDELTGFLYYKQGNFDSAAHYSAKSINMVSGKNDLARRAYLTAQLYQLANNKTLASDWYATSIRRSLDPVMEVYARLNTIRLNKSNDPKVIDENVAALLKLAKKDAYSEYRDIIYYFAGKAEQERNALEAAAEYYKKSTKTSTTNISQKNKSFFALADIAYSQRKYFDAANYYDSLQLNDPSITNPTEVATRKDVLKKLVLLTDIIAVEDSLQTVAKMTPNDRDSYIDKLLRKLRKEKGEKESAKSNGAVSTFSNDASTTLFDNNNGGQWYFYNSSVKSKGYNEFKRKWGTRPNVDNWRRAAAIGQTATSSGRGGIVTGAAAAVGTTTAGKTVLDKKTVVELTEEALLANLPLLPAEMKTSNDSIYSAMLSLGKIYQYNLEDVPAAIETYEQLIKRFSDTTHAEAWQNLILAYKKIGKTAEANSYEALLSKAGIKIHSTSSSKRDQINKVSNQEYNEVYGLFLEGKFEEALAKKKLIEEKSGSAHLWSAQLMYLEAIYYAKQRQDSSALAAIDRLITQHGNTPLGLKADRLKNVIERRAVIEGELRQLKITRNEDQIDTSATNTANTASATIQAVAANTPSINNNTTPTAPTNNTNLPNLPIATTENGKPKVIPAATPKYSYKTNDVGEQYIVVKFAKIDNIFLNEARNSFIVFNRGTGLTLNTENVYLDADNKLLLIRTFDNSTQALNYLEIVKTKVATEIIPWLEKEKYSFYMFTEANYKEVTQKKSWENYLAFLRETYPAKF